MGGLDKNFGTSSGKPQDRLPMSAAFETQFASMDLKLSIDL